jgi:hypothetical protein
MEATVCGPGWCRGHHSASRRSHRTPPLPLHRPAQDTPCSRRCRGRSEPHPAGRLADRHATRPTNQPSHQAWPRSRRITELSNRVLQAARGRERGVGAGQTGRARGRPEDPPHLGVERLSRKRVPAQGLAPEFPRLLPADRPAASGTEHAGPHSAEAVRYMLEVFHLPRWVAAPGFSNHQAGIAIDLQQERERAPIRGGGVRAHVGTVGQRCRGRTQYGCFA